ncbi:MAG: hypothetical protein GY811_15395 [Myxococcales bacterium]|nr:hypothetical protein [Myxococcales bacterium]
MLGGGYICILRREVASFFYAPIAYVVGVAFLALNGLSFWALMRALSDPTLPAHPGAVLRSFFGGTMLHWLVVFALVALLSMRSVAEDRRSGLWEAMLTTRVSVCTVLMAKWSALLVFYVLLWLPTVAFIAILNLYIPDGSSMDMGPILAAYIGVVGIGAALLAVGVAFSVSTENQVVAAVGCFSVLLAWLMACEVDLLPGAWHLRLGLEAAARGEVRLDSSLTVLTVAVVALAAAVAVAAHGRRVRWPGWTRTALLLSIFGSFSSLASRHNRSLDLSSGKLNTLEEATLVMLAELDADLELTVVRPKEQVFDPVFDELVRLLGRMQDVQPRLSVTEIDPLAAPEDVARWSYELAIRAEDFASGGAILVQRGQRRRSIDLLAMASFTADDLGIGSLAELRAEAAVREAIAEVVEQSRETLCSSTGHGELSGSKETSSFGSWSAIVERLQREGILLRSLRAIDSPSLKGCDALVLMGPGDALSPSAVLALQAYREEGGDLLLALRSQPISGGDVSERGAGLSMLLEQASMRVENAVVVDPAGEIELAPAWLTYEGYGDHPIVLDFHQRRATIWQTPWALRATTDAAHVLVEASAEGWGELSIELLHSSGGYEKNPGDIESRAVALATESEQGGRLVLFGSAEAFADTWSERGIGGNERLLISSIYWALHRDRLSFEAGGAGKRPERIRLLMSSIELRNAFIWCVLVGPAALALLGAFLWWWRRREP